MRFAVKSRRGPHVPLGHNGPKELRQEIDSKLTKVQRIKFEPRLLSPDDDRLTSGPHTAGCYDYLYRMRALDAIRDTDLPFRELGGAPSALTGRRFRTWLLELRTSHPVIQDTASSLIDTLLRGYDSARHGTEVFGEAEFVKYQEALTELASVVKTQSSLSVVDQHHQSAARDLSMTPEAPPLSSSSPSRATNQSASSSSAQQRAKRPKHFLELKNFKDKYDTLESSF